MKSTVILQIDLSEDLNLYNWLKDLMANKLYDDESSEEQEYREKMFNALNIVNAVKTPKVNSVRTVMQNAKQEQTRLHKLYEEDDIPF
jgi:hypothetical protein